MPQKLKLFISIFFLAEICLMYSTASAVTVQPLPTYSGVEGGITQYLCTPTANPTNGGAGNGVAQGTTGGGTGYVNFLTTGNSSVSVPNANSGDLYNCINKLYRFAIVISGVLGMFFIVIAGYVYMNAGGNQESVDKAKNMFTSTITAIVILMAGYVLLRAINPDLIQFQPIQPPSVVPTDQSTATIGLSSNQTAPDQDIAVSQETSCPPSGTNPGGYYRFSQCNGAWANTAYGSCNVATYGPSTIGTSACGPSSLATVIYNYQQQNKIPSKPVDPGIISQLAVGGGYRICGVGTAFGMFATVAQSYGLKSQQVPWSTAYAAIQKGIPVIGAMGPGYFTTGGHFVTFYGVDSSGNVMVADSGPRNIKTATPAIIQSQIQAAFILTPQ